MMFFDHDWLPVAFVILMGIAFLVYAILDGYDLGVGVLLPKNDQAQRDTMINSIGPFWDANETWLVLAVGLLLIAFPKAHSIVLQAMYLPVSIMLIGLIIRGVAFDFRIKGPQKDKHKWDVAFKIGSLIATLSQGYMLGRYVVAFDSSIASYLFAVLSAVCVTAGYCFIGSCWLVLKTTGRLQKKAANWGKISTVLMAIGVTTVSVSNLLISPEIADRWLGFPQLLIFIPLPILLLVLFSSVYIYFDQVPHKNDFGCWYPMIAAIAIFCLCFFGLAYSYFPYVVFGQLTIWQAASARESLMFIFYGAVIVLPAIALYTIFTYRVFRGKADELKYY